MKKVLPVIFSSLAMTVLFLCVVWYASANDITVSFQNQIPANTVHLETPITYTIEVQNIDDGVNAPSAISMSIRVQVNGTTVRADSGEITSDDCDIDPDSPSDFECFDLVEGASQTPSFTWHKSQPGWSVLEFVANCERLPEQNPPVLCMSSGATVETTTSVYDQTPRLVIDRPPDGSVIDVSPIDVDVTFDLPVNTLDVNGVQATRYEGYFRASGVALQEGSNTLTATAANDFATGTTSVQVTKIPAAELGDTVGSEFQVNTTTANDQDFPSVAFDADGNFVITWTSIAQDGDGVGVYAQRYSADGTPRGSEFRVNTTRVNDQYHPSLALDADGDFVITWTSIAQDGDGAGIYAQRYGADGTPRGSEFRVNTTTADDQAFASVALDVDGDFVITWTSLGQDSDGAGVYAQRYSADGTPRDGEFRVNITTTYDQGFSSVDLDADGNFVIVWASWGCDERYCEEIVAQRYSADGTPRGDEFWVATEGGSDRFPSVALDPDGDFVIAWFREKAPRDEIIGGVYARRYGSDGTPRGREFQVNATTALYQAPESVVLDVDGDSLIAWASFAQDGDGWGIHAQRYGGDGTPRGSEFRVNTTTAGDQNFPTVTVEANGNFVVAWTSIGQDGDGAGIYAQRFAGPVPVPDIKINGSDGPLILTFSDTLQLSLRLNNNGRTEFADWWLAGDSPYGFLFWTPTTGWIYDQRPAYQGRLYSMRDFRSPILPVGESEPRVDGLAPGKYTLYFGVDLVMDSTITWSSLYVDSIEVNIVP